MGLRLTVGLGLTRPERDLERCRDCRTDSIPVYENVFVELS